LSQERSLLRRMENRGACGQWGVPPQPAWTPQDEQDAKRDRLAEQVLLEMIEKVSWEEDAAGEPATRLKAEEALRTAAHAALAAAEVIYPELPEPVVEGKPLTGPALDGARMVNPDNRADGAAQRGEG
jgi:hypothetical protein